MEKLRGKKTKVPANGVSKRYNNSGVRVNGGYNIRVSNRGFPVPRMKYLPKLIIPHGRGSCVHGDSCRGKSICKSLCHSGSCRGEFLYEFVSW